MSGKEHIRKVTNYGNDEDYCEAALREWEGSYTDGADILGPKDPEERRQMIEQEQQETEMFGCNEIWKLKMEQIF